MIGPSRDEMHIEYYNDMPFVIEEPFHLNWGSHRSC